MKGDRMAKRSSLGSIVRKRLSDITNSLPQPKSPVHVEKVLPDASSSKDHIDRLVKENLLLVKTIHEKNEIIKLTGHELQKMRITLQKLQLQNWNLAQSNSHMLAELNLNKDKLKSLQHHLICKEAILKVKNREMEGQGQLNTEGNGMQNEVVAPTEAQPNDSKPTKANRRGIRSRSLGHSSTTQVAEKEMAESKRRCLRRQSTTSKLLQQEPAENLFEIEDTTLPIGGECSTPLHKDGIASLPSSREQMDSSNGSGHWTQQEPKRTSIGRPLRKAAEKVHSYKEKPLNVKMRRVE